MNSAKHCATPIRSSSKIDNGYCRSFDEKRHRGMIGSLFYVTAHRLDLLFNVYLCAYQAGSKESHLRAVKQISNTLRAL